jgi:hypothetical protein
MDALLLRTRFAPSFSLYPTHNATKQLSHMKLDDDAPVVAAAQITRPAP